MLHTQITRTGSNTFIGMDIGGTNTRIGLFASLDLPEFRLVAKFPTYQSYEEQLHHIVVAIRGSKIQHLASVGVSFAARIAKDGHSIILAPSRPDYVNKRFAEDLFY